MKNENSEKRLILNKSTISNLEKTSMSELKGGLRNESYVDPEVCKSHSPSWCGDNYTVFC